MVAVRKGNGARDAVRPASREFGATGKFRFRLERSSFLDRFRAGLHLPPNDALGVMETRMRTVAFKALSLVAVLGITACDATNGEADSTGGSSNGTGGSDAVGGGGSTGGQAPGGGAGSGGSSATGGTSEGSTGGSGGSTGGSGGSIAGSGAGGSGQAGSTGDAGSGGSSATGGSAATDGAGGSSAGTANGGAASGGTASAGTGGASAPGDGCVVGAWPTADPSAAGPYKVITENEVGPEAGEAGDDGIVPKFTLFRPDTLSPGGLCHPVVTWGNGTGATPNLYKSLLGNLASHGFVVIGSNSKNVGQGDPKPMLVGVTWIIEQNEDPASVLYHHLDVTHIGATGHSQGAFATSSAAGDSRITTNVPIEGAMVQRNLHGPSMFFCGGMDDIVGCDGAHSAIDDITTLPAMYAEYLSVDHGSWLGRSGKPSVVESTVTAWMRVHLMADASLRSWFYGASCKLCTDTGWSIERKNMDE